MQIELANLRAITENLFHHFEEQGIESFDISADYYWNISRKQIYDPYNKPTDLDLGQLTDDWQELSKLLRLEVQPLGYYLVWLAAILRAIGENTSD